MKYAIATIIMLLLALMFLLHQFRGAKRESASLASALSEKNSEIEMHVTRSGKLVAEKRAAEMRLQDIQRSYPEIKKQIEEDFNVKLSRTRAYMQAQFEASGKGSAVVVHDTVWIDSAWTCPPFALVAQDGYLSFQADVYSPTDAPYSYVYSDTISTVFTMKGKWWQKKELYSRSMLQNKNAQVVGSTSILVKEHRDRRWGIGPYIGVGLGADLRPQTNFGIAVQYSLIRL